MTRGSVSLSCATTPHPFCFSKSSRYKIWLRKFLIPNLQSRDFYTGDQRFVKIWEFLPRGMGFLSTGIGDFCPQDF